MVIHANDDHVFHNPVEDFVHTYEDDPYTPVTPRAPINRTHEVVILGGGWSGIMAGVALKRAGIDDFCNIDHAGDFGGVWYWNRYPGLQCDNDAYCYFPMLEEMNYMPSKKFTEGYEILAYAQSICKKYGLYDNALFHTLVNTLRWDDASKHWLLGSKQGDQIRARHLIVANGLLNIPKLPGIPGIHEFKGHLFHSARWDYEYTGGSQREPVLDKLHDKRVAIVGTGATAVQLVPYLGRYAKHFYVLQRTPSCVDTRRNSETDPDWVKTLKPGWQEARRQNFHRGANERYLPGEPDLIVDIWTEVNRHLSDEFNAEDHYPDLQEYAERRDLMDLRVMERLRRRVDAIVKDPQTAEKLKPYYRYQCKRPTSNDHYYETFNRPNVTLVDVSETQGVERLTERGFIANGEEYPIDCMIFASGYEVTSDLNRRWGFKAFTGRNGFSMYDNWAGGYKTFHGVMTHGFPNLYLIGLNQGGLNSTLTANFEAQTRHIAHIIDQAKQRGGVATVEPTREAQDAYVQHIRDTEIDRTEWIRECTPGYFNNEGKPDVDEHGNEKYRFYLGEVYGPGWDAFMKLLADWRNEGTLPGLKLE